MNNNYKNYLTKCACGATTSKSYARANAGKCKQCVTGIVKQERDTTPASVRLGYNPESAFERYHEVMGHNDLSPDF